MPPSAPALSWLTHWHIGSCASKMACDEYRHSRPQSASSGAGQANIHPVGKLAARHRTTGQARGHAMRDLSASIVRTVRAPPCAILKATRKAALKAASRTVRQTASPTPRTTPCRTLVVPGPVLFRGFRAFVAMHPSVFAVRSCGSRAAGCLPVRLRCLTVGQDVVEV